MTTEGQRLREHLKLVGEAKAQSHAEMTKAHLALPIGERIRRVVALSDTVLEMHIAAFRSRGEPLPPRDDEFDVAQRVYEKLQRTRRDG